MSSAVVSTSAALGRHFIFDDESDPVSPCHPKAGGKCAESISRGVEGSLRSTDSRLARIIPASRLEIRPAPEMVSGGIADLDALTGGLPRGCLTEICGPASSGRTTVLLATLAAATRRGEFCALIDASDSLDPHSATTSGLELDRLLWVRCSEDSPRIHSSAALREGSGTGKKFSEELPVNPSLSRSILQSAAQAGASKGFSGNVNPRPPVFPESVQSSWKKNPKNQTQPDARQSEHRLDQVLRATDLLLESGGFGLIALDLADMSTQAARRIPLTTWFRFRRAIEHTPTILLVIEQQPIAGSCSSLLVQLGSSRSPSSQLSVVSCQNVIPQQIHEQDLKPPHAQLLTGLEISAELIRSRLSPLPDLDSPPNRKPAGSVSIAFNSKTSWG